MRAARQAATGAGPRRPSIIWVPFYSHIYDVRRSSILIGGAQGCLREDTLWSDKLRLYLARDSLHPFLCASRTIAEMGNFLFKFLDPPFSCAQFVCEIVSKSHGTFVHFVRDADRFVQYGDHSVSGLVDRIM
jgi:hypothetical protein